MTSRPNLLERALRLFTDVAPGEGAKAVLLTINVFLLLTCNYILTPIREALILSGEKAAMASYSAAGQALLLMLLIPAYSRLASRVPRLRLITTVILIFISNLIVFFLLAAAKTPRLGIPFFIWVGIFNVGIVAQFWSFANDVYTPEQGKRLFVIVAFGANLGAILGGVVTEQLLKPLGVMVVVSNFVNSNGEYPLRSAVQSSAERLIAAGQTGGLDLARFKAQYVGVFYAGYQKWTSILTALIQLFVVSRVFKWFGVRIALLLLPAIAMGGYGLLALLPFLQNIRLVKIAENATDYSLQNTTRHTLFLPTSREAKYKAKAVTDTFLQRFGDVLSAGLVLAASSMVVVRHNVAAINVALIAAWLLVVVALGRRYSGLVKDRDRATES